jgi:hypothetical protein
MVALTNGLILCSAPVTASFMYGLPTEEGDRVILARRSFGNNLFAMGVFGAALLVDVSHITACGMAWASCFVGLLWLFSDLKRAKMNSGILYSWLAAMAFFAYTLSYQQPTNEDVKPNEV